MASIYVIEIGCSPNPVQSFIQRHGRWSYYVEPALTLSLVRFATDVEIEVSHIKAVGRTPSWGSAATLLHGVAERSSLSIKRGVKLDKAPRSCQKEVHDAPLRDKNIRLM